MSRIILVLVMDMSWGDGILGLTRVAVQEWE